MRAYEKSVIFFLAFIATELWLAHLDLGRIETSLKQARPVVFVLPAGKTSGQVGVNILIDPAEMEKFAHRQDVIEGNQK